MGYRVSSMTSHTRSFGTLGADRDRREGRSIQLDALFGQGFQMDG